MSTDLSSHFFWIVPQTRRAEETIITQNPFKKYIYPIKNIKKGDENIISRFGTAMYTQEHEVYLKNRIDYFTKKTQSDPKAIEILKALQTISQNDKQRNH